jgi:hypothetical protein
LGSLYCSPMSVSWRPSAGSPSLPRLKTPLTRVFWCPSPTRYSSSSVRPLPLRCSFRPCRVTHLPCPPPSPIPTSPILACLRRQAVAPPRCCRSPVLMHAQPVVLGAPVLALIMEAEVVDQAAEHDPFSGDFVGSDCYPCPEVDAGDEQDGERSRDRRAPPQSKVGLASRVRDITLEKLRARLQVPPDGPFDRTDITWEVRTNQGRGRCRDTSRAIIP